MVSLELTAEGYDGIPATNATMTVDELKQWADTKDPALIPLAIAWLKYVPAIAKRTGHAAQALCSGAGAGEADRPR